MEETEGVKENEDVQGFYVKLCMVGRFINEGVVDFMAMKHMLASIWRPGKGVWLKLDVIHIPVLS